MKLSLCAWSVLPERVVLYGVTAALGWGHKGNTDPSLLHCSVRGTGREPFSLEAEELLDDLWQQERPE